MFKGHFEFHASGGLLTHLQEEQKMGLFDPICLYVAYLASAEMGQSDSIPCTKIIFTQAFISSIFDMCYHNVNIPPKKKINNNKY